MPMVRVCPMNVEQQLMAGSVRNDDVKIIEGTPDYDDLVEGDGDDAA